MKKGFSIAIDGPVAAGKGTVVAALMNKLVGFSVDTGSMYRCIALLCIQNNLNSEKENDVIRVLAKANIEFKDSKVYLNGIDVTNRIKEPDVAELSSVVAAHKMVREDLVAKQQQIAKTLISEGKIVILDGRDTGTMVLPGADLKIFLTAGLEIRAKRSLERYKQKGIVKNLDEVSDEIKIRDYRDSHRKVGPLPLEPEKFGYWILDDSNQTEKETVDAVISKLREKGLIDD